MDVRVQIMFHMVLLLGKLKILIVHTGLSCQFKQALLCLLFINLVLTRKKNNIYQDLQREKLLEALVSQSLMQEVILVQ